MVRVHRAQFNFQATKKTFAAVLLCLAEVCHTFVNSEGNKRSKKVKIYPCKKATERTCHVQLTKVAQVHDCVYGRLRENEVP